MSTEPRVIELNLMQRLRLLELLVRADLTGKPVRGDAELRAVIAGADEGSDQ